jgi:nucleoside-diphosphate-sugar epimerase
MTPPKTKSEPVRIFLTGVTGFVGGAVLAALHETHPNIAITALVRKEADANTLQSAYPMLTPIIGDLTLLPLLTSCAAAADFVIHMSGDNMSAVCAMIDGLASSSSTSESPQPRLISVSGPRSLIDRSLPVTGVTKLDSHVWSDITDAAAILSLPKERMHAEADQAIVAHGIAMGVGTILVSPGQQWGRGKGLLKQESHAATYYAAVKKRGRAFVIGDGSIAWSWSSISDLSYAIVFLMEQALLSGKERSAQVGINNEGYYFVRTGDLSLIERATAVSQRLGLGEVESVPPEIAADIHQYGPLMWGCGARFRADRLQRLGWKPKEVDWRALMEEHGGERA